MKIPVDLLTRTVYAEVPARVDYELTHLGHSASVPLRGLRDWVEDDRPTNMVEFAKAAIDLLDGCLSRG